ncbi:hypothetical protein N172_20550 [Pantoea dispersa EGD-AAK13]|jgi:hypothetical protein|nr:hypothetical protein N172_20550 [Pantoea dispersa EGD-AAK13]
MPADRATWRGFFWIFCQHLNSNTDTLRAGKSRCWRTGHPRQAADTLHAFNGFRVVSSLFSCFSLPPVKPH